MFLIVSFTDKTNTSEERLQDKETFLKKYPESGILPIPGINKLVIRKLRN